MTDFWANWGAHDQTFEMGSRIDHCRWRARAASAADMALKAPPLPVAVVYSWTGCYVGASGRGLWAHKRWVDSDPLSTTFNQTRFDHTTSGGMAGGQIGCDYQTGRWVFGIEGSYHWANLNATSIDRIFNTVSGTTNVSGSGRSRVASASPCSTAIKG